MDRMMQRTSPRPSTPESEKSATDEPKRKRSHADSEPDSQPPSAEEDHFAGRPKQRKRLSINTALGHNLPGRSNSFQSNGAE
ncbi:hypothetical protein HK104_007995, partial [Borealophlyctis nickersoniae]